MQTVAFLITVAVASALKLPTQDILKPELVNTKELAKSLTTAPPRPVFYMTAMAKLAVKHQTRLWLQSLRHTGKWTGEVVIVTDKPTCLEKNLGLKLLGGARISETEDFIVYPGGAGMGKVYVIKQPTTQDVKKMKQEKAMAWINIRAIGLNPSHIIYTDQDIVFGMDVFSIVTLARILEGKGYTMALFIDQGVTKGQLHTGILFMYPGEATDKCLADWAVEIMKTSASPYHGFTQEAEEEAEEPEEPELMKAEMMGPDQRALGATKSCQAGNGIYILPKTELMMPTAKALSQGYTATFIHFTNTNRWKNIKPAVKDEYFSSVLGLEKMEWEEYETC
jgi:hypothetical protein